MSKAATKLGRGLDAQAVTSAVAGTRSFPLTVQITNLSRQSVVLAQATPTLVIAAGDSAIHKCQTRAHLHDVIFGMIAVGDRLGHDIIGSITTRLPREASKL